jgi:hypothetical protein
MQLVNGADDAAAAAAADVGSIVVGSRKGPGRLESWHATDPISPMITTRHFKPDLNQRQTQYHKCSAEVISSGSDVVGNRQWLECPCTCG